MLINFHKKALNKPSKKLNLKSIINISHTTTEKIETIYLNDFLNTCIISSKQKININSRVFYSYFEKNNLYEIFFIETYSSKEVPLPFIFSEIHNKQLDEVFLYDRFFIVYSMGEFKLFKEIPKEISSNDILNFILHRYEIDIDKIHKFSANEINEITNKYISNKKRITPLLINLKKDKKVFYLFSFIILLSLIPLIHYNFIYKEKKQTFKTDKKLHSLEKRYQNLLEQTDKKKSSKLINTLLQIKNFDLKLKSINLNKNKIHLFIESKNKITLLEFIDMYDGDIKINKLTFNQKTQKYDLEAIVVI